MHTADVYSSFLLFVLSFSDPCPSFAALSHTILNGSWSLAVLAYLYSRLFYWTVRTHFSSQFLVCFSFRCETFVLLVLCLMHVSNHFLVYLPLYTPIVAVDRFFFLS